MVSLIMMSQTKTTYDVWVHYNSRSAKHAGLISSVPLRERIGWEANGPQYRNLPNQDHFVLEVAGSNWMLDDLACMALLSQYRAKHPGEKRPLAGRSYLRDCRPKFTRAA